jgi:hypothetical protein
MAGLPFVAEMIRAGPTEPADRRSPPLSDTKLVMTKTSKRILLSAASVVLGACAHVQTMEWRSSTGATSSQLQQDALECQFKIRAALFPAILAGKADSSAFGDLEQMCMNAKGYYQVEKKDAGEVTGRRPLMAQGELARGWMPAFTTRLEK